MAAGSIYGDQIRVGRTMGDHPAPRTQTVVAINSKAAAPLDEVNIIADAETYSGNIDVFCSTVWRMFGARDQFLVFSFMVECRNPFHSCSAAVAVRWLLSAETAAAFSS